MSNRRILGFALLAAAVVLWLVLGRFLGWIGTQAGVTPPPLFGVFPVPALIATVLAAAAGVAVWRHASAHAFLLDVVDELSKVVWPNRQETQDSTLVVVVTVVLVSVVLWAFDLVWLELSKLVL